MHIVLKRLFHFEKPGMQSIAFKSAEKFDNTMTIQTDLKGYVSAVESPLSPVHGPQKSSKRLTVETDRLNKLKISVDC